MFCLFSLIFNPQIHNRHDTQEPRAHSGVFLFLHSHASHSLSSSESWFVVVDCRERLRDFHCGFILIYPPNSEPIPLHSAGTRLTHAAWVGHQFHSFPSIFLVCRSPSSEATFIQAHLLSMLSFLDTLVFFWSFVPVLPVWFAAPLIIYCKD